MKIIHLLLKAHQVVHLAGVDLCFGNVLQVQSLPCCHTFYTDLYQMCIGWGNCMPLDEELLCDVCTMKMLVAGTIRPIDKSPVGLCSSCG